MDSSCVGDLGIISMRGSEDFAGKVEAYVREWRDISEGDCIIPASFPRFGTGEGKGLLKSSVRGRDIYIIVDCYNYSVKYKMYGMEVPMSPDDHFQDLKRVISAIGGKARRITVIMPMLYEGRQHKRTARESLDCALALQELVRMGVSNFITFDAHDVRVQNAIPLSGFDNMQPTYQMIKALLRNIKDVKIDDDNLIIISPDEGGIHRCMYYSSVLNVNLGMFYKRRNYAVIIDGRNPIEAHEYLGNDVQGKDAIIVDDMISSGDSILDICSTLKQRGAKRIFVFASFGLFCNGLERFDEAYQNKQFDKIFTTNLIYRSEELLKRNWYVEVDMSKYVAYIIDTLNHDTTISTLIDPFDRIKKLLNTVK